MSSAVRRVSEAVSSPLAAPGNPGLDPLFDLDRSHLWPVRGRGGDDRLVSGKQIKVFLVDGTPRRS